MTSEDRYPMCKDQPAQIDCRVVECQFHNGGACSNVSPAIALYPGGRFICWTMYNDTFVAACNNIHK